MIDNVKFFINDYKGFEENLCKTSDVQLKTFVDNSTGEMIDYPKIGKYHNMDVRITKQQAYLKGSLHKFLNVCLEAEEHNYNDFDLRDIGMVVQEIVSMLKIDPNATSVTNLEFGFNVELDDDPQKLIDHNLLMYNFKNHNKDLKFRNQGDYKQYDMSDYSLKIYNKSKQYGRSKHILRVEVKFLMKRKLTNLGVYSLADLTNVQVLKNLFNFFIEQVDKLVILDLFYERPDIKDKDRNRLGLFTNPNYWMNAAVGKSPHVRERLIREYKRLITKYKLDSIKQTIKHKLEMKFQEMMGFNVCPVGVVIPEM